MTNYLERAVTSLRSIGVNINATEQVPVLALLDKVAQYDPAKVTGIAATLQYSSTFNASIREQIGGMDISTRFLDIADSFNSIRDDAAEMAGWMADGKVDFKERLQLSWMKLRRGSIPDRFALIRTSFLDVCKTANDQIKRESVILNAYQDFRMQMKVSEVDAQSVMKIAEATLNAWKKTLQQANEAIETATQSGDVDGAQMAALELSRDEALRSVQDEDKTYQIVKDIADDLKTGYNTAELVFARVQQTSTVKERLYQRMAIFFSTNEIVLSGLAASFTTNSGLAEATNAMNATVDGTSRGLESLGTTGQKELGAAMRASYGSTIKAQSVKVLADAIVEFQSNMHKDVAELRLDSTNTANEIEAASEDSKRRFAALIAKVV